MTNVFNIIALNHMAGKSEISDIIIHHDQAIMSIRFIIPPRATRKIFTGIDKCEDLDSHPYLMAMLKASVRNGEDEIIQRFANQVFAGVNLEDIAEGIDKIPFITPLAKCCIVTHLNKSSEAKEQIQMLLGNIEVVPSAKTGSTRKKAEQNLEKKLTRAEQKKFAKAQAELYKQESMDADDQWGIF